jgi:hypothetical protein
MNCKGDSPIQIGECVCTVDERRGRFMGGRFDDVLRYRGTVLSPPLIAGSKSKMCRMGMMESYYLP